MSKIRKLSYEEIQASRPGLEDISQKPRHPVVVLCDDIRSLHNIGAIFRTADGAFVEKIYLCGISGKPPRNEIRKTSLGAEESVPWEYAKDAENVVSDLKLKGYQIVALEHTDSSIDYRKADYKFPLCLIVGHEFHGVSDNIVEKADMAIDLPMRGIKQSLNVSVAFGIAVYEIINKLE
jgi:tRNA G18 (ribose-2'-O)-methylase SpoU